MSCYELRPFGRVPMSRTIIESFAFTRHIAYHLKLYEQWSDFGIHGGAFDAAIIILLADSSRTPQKRLEFAVNPDARISRFILLIAVGCWELESTTVGEICPESQISRLLS